MPSLLILDSNAIDTTQPGCLYGYLRQNSSVRIVPARVAREEAERASSPTPTPPLDREHDAPAPLLLNDPLRVLNDSAAVLLSPRLAIVRRELARLYPNPDNHTADILNVACAVAYGEAVVTQNPAMRAYFVSGDRMCCNKATEFARRDGTPVQPLYARKANARAAAPGVRELADVFPPKP